MEKLKEWTYCVTVMCMVPHSINKGYIDAWKTCLENNISPSSGGAETRIQTHWNTTQNTTHLVKQVIIPGSFARKLPEVMKKYMTKRDRGLLKPLPDG